MLTALENGVKGGRWHCLIDKVFAPRTMRGAFAKVKANRGAAGVDHQTTAMFDRRLDENLNHLHESLRHGTYEPQRIRRKEIPKPGSREMRPLGIPTVRDRVVQGALRAVIEPIFEDGFAPHSYGFRPERGCKDALRRVDSLLKQGYVWVVDADLKSYFDTIPRDRLMQLISGKISDGRILRLIEAFLRQDVLETAKAWSPKLDEGRGTPQGAVISPLLSNIYLDPLDYAVAEKGFEMVRYADDFVVLCRTEQEAREALAVVQQWVTENGLMLHPEKTRIVKASEGNGFDFLGYRFKKGWKFPSPKSEKRLKDAIRVKTKRTNGRCLRATINDVNRTTEGWFEYFKHSHRATFNPLDRWIRKRLRSILRKRRKRRGPARGKDHQRWPNAFFTAQGLYCMLDAFDAARQSARR